MTMTQIRKQPLILTLLLLAVFFSSYGQTYNPTNFTASNKSLGLAQAVSTDARSWMFDSTAAHRVMRDYNGTTEVYSYLNLPTYRSGHFPIFVHSGGVLQSTGVWIGGVTLVYWFKDSTGNANLVRWYTDSTGNVGGPFFAIANNLSEGNAGLIKGNLALDMVNNTSDAQKNAAAVSLTNHTISGLSNTLTNIGNSSLVNSTIGLAVTSNAAADIAVTSTPASLGNSLIVNFPTATATQRGPLAGADWQSFHLKIDSIHISLDSAYNCSNGTCTFAGLIGGGGSGTVNNFSAGNLSPLFTTAVATSTTTPALSFLLSTTIANSILGNNTGSTAAPAYFVPTSSTLNGWFGGAIQGALTLTTTGSSGAATLIGNTLNIPVYGSGGGTDSGVAVLNGILASRSATGPTVYLQADSSAYATRARVQKGIDSLGAVKQPAGNYITALTGDVAATGPGIVAATIQPHAVTYSKMATNTANTLLGYDNSGNAANITPSNGLSEISSSLGLGEPLAQSGNPAQFVSHREIPLNGKKLILYDSLNTNILSGVSFWDTVGTGGLSPLKIIQKGNNVQVTPGGSSGYFHLWETSNFGHVYNSIYAPTGPPFNGSTRQDRYYSSYQLAANNDGSGDEGGQPDAVVNFFSYNISPGSGRLNNMDGAYRFAAETNFIGTVLGTKPNFEFHLPEVTSFDGVLSRVNSYYIDKTTNYALNNLNINAANYLSVFNQNHPYLSWLAQGNDTSHTSGLMTFFGDDLASVAGEIDFAHNTFPLADIASFQGYVFQETNNHAFATALNPTGDFFTAPFGGYTIVGPHSALFRSSLADTCAMLAVYGTKKGFLPPRMVTADKLAIGNPTSGLIVYDTTLEAPYYWNNTAWVPMSGGSGSANSNIGSGYRWAIPFTNNIKTIVPDAGVTIDSSTNTNALTIFNNLSTGVSGGQTAIGGTGSADNLTLSSTSNATKGRIVFGSASYYDEATNKLLINSAGIGLGESIVGATLATTGTGIASFGNGGGDYLAVLHTGSTSNYAGYGSGLNTFIVAPDFNSGTYRPLAFGAGGLTRQTILTNGHVGINNVTPDASAQLDVASTTAGALIPRMNTTQQNAISSPATGLIIYNTDSSGLVDYNGTAWRKERSNSGVTTLGTPTTAQANGAAITGNTLSLSIGDATHPGILANAAQTFSGDKTFVGNVIGFDATYSAQFYHFVSIATTGASLSPGSGAGTSPTTSVSGTDQSGLITITTGTSPSGSNATIATLSYSRGWPNNTYPVLTPGNAAAAALTGIGQVFVTSSSTSSFVISSGTSALAGGTTYKWYYYVGGN